MTRFALCVLFALALHAVLAVLVVTPVVAMAVQTGDLATSMSIVAQR